VVLEAVFSKKLAVASRAPEVSTSFSFLSLLMIRTILLSAGVAKLFVLFAGMFTKVVITLQTGVAEILCSKKSLKRRDDVIMPI